MQKLLLSVLLILAIFAVPMVAQDEPKKEDPAKEEPKADPKPDGIEPVEPVDPKVEAETKAWTEIQDMIKKYRNRSTSREERSKIYAAIFPAFEKYVEEHWGVNKDNSKSAVRELLSYYSRGKKTDKYLVLTDKCLKSDFYEAKEKTSIRFQRSEMYLDAEKYELALGELKDVKLPEGELDTQGQIESCVYFSIKARVAYKQDKKEDYKKFIEKLAEIRKTVTDDKVKNYFRYYIMKINKMTVVAGTVAPNWKVIDFDGKEVELKSFKGKYVLLDFWATWCGPCKYAMENHLKPMSKKYKSIADKFMILSIGSASERETIAVEKKFIEDKGYDWTFLYDKEKTAAEAYGVTGIPTLVFIDPEGKIVFIGHGEVAEKVQKYLDEKFKIGEEEKPEEAPEEGDTKKEDF